MKATTAMGSLAAILWAVSAIVAAEPASDHGAKKRSTEGKQAVAAADLAVNLIKSAPTRMAETHVMALKSRDDSSQGFTRAADKAADFHMDSKESKFADAKMLSKQAKSSHAEAAGGNVPTTKITSTVKGAPKANAYGGSKQLSAGTQKDFTRAAGHHEPESRD